MAKTKRVMRESLSQVDVIIELLDARIPYSSKNPEIEALIGDKPKITVLTKANLANPDANRAWVRKYERKGQRVVLIDSLSGAGIDSLAEAVREILAEKIERYNAKGMVGKALKAMIVGIPNVGKSSLINRIAGEKKAKVENRPGVTLNKQWVSTSIGLDLLDMPGILWPKFEDQTVGQNLAVTGAIRDEVMDIELLACVLCARLRVLYPELLCARYKLKAEEFEDLQDFELAELIGRRRGFLISGGEVDFLRTSNMLLDEFRGGKIGRITLEHPVE
jgi:ribosome biogenesis GTPase A